MMEALSAQARSSEHSILRLPDHAFAICQIACLDPRAIVGNAARVADPGVEPKMAVD
jgi:hypothetical protein